MWDRCTPALWRPAVPSAGERGSSGAAAAKLSSLKAVCAPDFQARACVRVSVCGGGGRERVTAGSVSLWEECVTPPPPCDSSNCKFNLMFGRCMGRSKKGMAAVTHREVKPWSAGQTRNQTQLALHKCKWAAHDSLQSPASRSAVPYTCAG